MAMSSEFQQYLNKFRFQSTKRVVVDDKIEMTKVKTTEARCRRRSCRTACTTTITVSNSLKCTSPDKHQFIYVFEAGKDDTYKIGRTNCLQTRKNCYATGIPDFEFVYARPVPSKKIETIVFQMLDKYRLEKKREFFRVSLDKIKLTIDKSCELFSMINEEEPPEQQQQQKKRPLDAEAPQQPNKRRRIL